VAGARAHPQGAHRSQDAGQALSGTVWAALSPAARMALAALSGLGWLIVLLSTFMIDHFDLFGLRQVFLRLKGRAYAAPHFQQRAFYNFVRHPIMLGFLIAFWATPRMSLGHLLFALATSGYILIGVSLEERDLLAAHGADYEAYRSQVPMLLPLARPRGRALHVARGTPK
jgi:protein-S-isoprenylcysteine O-methyltransferase Ste14